jgi:hypothetical protein
MEQCFSFTTLQHKHQHKPNFSISSVLENISSVKKPDANQTGGI